VDKRSLAHPAHTTTDPATRAGDGFFAAGKRRASTGACAGCGERFPRGELVEVQESLTYFESDLLCEECWHGSDAVVL
jgi:hypothetical protein